MISEISERIADFHVRLGRLEETQGRNFKKKDSAFEDAVEFISACVALLCCYYGFGLPNHPYQYVFGILMVSVFYHKGSFPIPKHWHEWILLVINMLVLSMLLKVVIGGGEPKPFNWFTLPALEGGLTSFKISWQQTAVSEWALPLTTIQTFFLVLTLFGTLIGFDLFCGLTTFVLVLLALPSLVSFNWTWALPAMISALFSFYLQADEAELKRDK